MKIARIPSDPVVFTRVILRIYKHLDDREMSLTHQRIITAILLLCRFDDRGATLRDVAKETGLTQQEVLAEMPVLIESRYVYHDVPTFGQNDRYRLGPVGQTFANSVRREFERGLVKEEA